MELIFNKGIIRFSDNSGKAYRISINDNTIQNEQTKRFLKNLPSDLIIYLRNTFADNDNLHLNNFRSCIIGSGKEIMRKELLFADKLASLNMTLYTHSFPTLEDVNFVKKNFADFARFRKENFDTEKAVSFDNVLYQFRINYRRNQLTKYAARDSAEFCILEDWYKNETFEKEEYKVPYIMYFLNHGLMDFCRSDKNFTDYWSTRGGVISIIEKYFNYCKVLNREPQKGDIFKQIIEMSQIYQMKKSEIEAEAIAKIKEEFFNKINFSTDDYFVHIPTTAKEFENEAEQMHNCVYRAYLPKVITHNTIIVFIRKKENPSASYITCEININTGKIEQFLCKFNHTPTDPEDKAFKKLYQEFLDNNF